MATAATGSVTRTAPDKRARTQRRFEHLFFSGMALLILWVVLYGFRAYFLAGVFGAHLPSLLVHIHGAAFTLWVLLLVTQTSLVRAGRVDVHRRLGIAGFLLACVMVVLGILTPTAALARGVALPGMDPGTFYAVPMLVILFFGTLIFFAFRARFQPAAHKRIILIATIALTSAAFTRWPIAHLNVQVAFLFTYILLACLVVYDLWSMRRVHPATVWAGAFMVFVDQMSLIVGKTGAWHAFAGWAQRFGHW